ncbi:MAG: hypothetical protein V1944_02045 [Candidatus Aenigmatarchaeota archaeon]
MKAIIIDDISFRQRAREFLHRRPVATPRIVKAEINGDTLEIYCQGDGTGVYKVGKIFEPGSYLLLGGETKVSGKEGTSVVRVKQPSIGDMYKVNVYGVTSSHYSHETVLVI